MTESMVRVCFRKQVSDGNYGTESAEVTLEDVADDADADAMAELLLLQARRLVHAELARSPSANVRRTLGPRPPQPVLTGSSFPGPPTDYPDEDPVG